MFESLNQLNEEQQFRRHPFPVLDFKFRNSGTGAAFLTQYYISVLSAEIDQTPELRFDLELAFSSVAKENRRLLGRSVVAGLDVSTKNLGWGDARNLRLSLVGKSGSLFSLPLGHVDRVHDDNKVPVLALRHEHLNMSTFAGLAEETAREYQGRMANQDRRTTAWRRAVPSAIAELLARKEPFVEIPSIDVKWNYLDANGKSYDNHCTLHYGDETLLCTRQGFLVVSEYEDLYAMAAGGHVPPGPMFCVLIDPDKGAQERRYPISRRISAGDVERFQVLIGATKSCFLDVQLAFDVDRGKKVTSEVFKLQVVNRRDQKAHDEYCDGLEILETFTEAQEKHLKSRRAGRWWRR